MYYNQHLHFNMKYTFAGSVNTPRVGEKFSIHLQSLVVNVVVQHCQLVLYQMLLDQAGYLLCASVCQFEVIQYGIWNECTIIFIRDKFFEIGSWGLQKWVLA